MFIRSARSATPVRTRARAATDDNTTTGSRDPHRRSLKPIRQVAVGLLAVVVCAPITLTAQPAAAGTTLSGCLITPLKPYFDGINTSGVKLVRYKVEVICQGQRTAEIQQQRLESDPSPDADDFLGSSPISVAFPYAAIEKPSRVQALANTEAGYEEVYQRIRFRVHSFNNVTSPWTAWESSPILSILD